MIHMLHLTLFEPGTHWGKDPKWLWFYDILKTVGSLPRTASSRASFKVLEIRIQMSFISCLILYDWNLHKAERDPVVCAGLFRNLYGKFQAFYAVVKCVIVVSLRDCSFFWGRRGLQNGGGVSNNVLSAGEGLSFIIATNCINRNDHTYIYIYFISPCWPPYYILNHTFMLFSAFWLVPEMTK